jgi:hypothetical protein
MDDDVVGRDGTTSESGKEMYRTASLLVCVAAWLRGCQEPNVETFPK